MATQAPEWVRETRDRGRMALAMVEAMPTDENRMIAAGLRCVFAVGEKNMKAIEEGKPLVWQHLLMTPEIFRAMDIQTFNADTYSPQMAGLRKEGPAEFIDVAEDAGVPIDTCSILKGDVGAILAGQMPTPSLFVTQSHPCDAMVAGLQMVQNLVKVPTFCLDAPVWNDDRAIDYYARQMKEMVAFLEEHTGRKLDQDRLREVVEESNRVMELRLAVKELKRAVPCPLNYLLSWLAFQVYFAAASSPEATDFFRQLLEYTEEKVKAGKGAVPEEKVRVVWGGPPMFYGDVAGWMERQWGAVMVDILWGYEGYHYIDTSSYDSMMRGIAQKQLNQIMTREFRGPFEYYLDDFLRAYDEYKGDCLIFPGGIACKSLQATMGILKDVCREKGIPMLVVGFEFFDERITPEETTRAQIEQFFATTVLQ